MAEGERSLEVGRGAHDDDGDGGAWGLGKWLALEPQQQLGLKRRLELPLRALAQPRKPGMEERVLEQP